MHIILPSNLTLKTTIISVSEVMEMKHREIKLLAKKLTGSMLGAGIQTEDADTGQDLVSTTSVLLYK